VNPDSRYQPLSYVRLTHPEWSRSAVIYQINTRQFTAEGTFRAAEAHLPRLKALGVDILWLMPIHPIGEVNRKGSLGSPYSVRDYYGVNPEFGTLQDFRHFVDAAHTHGFHVILDWVANHTAWDNPLVTEHPDWYARDWKGEFHPTPWWDWSDIIELDYQNPALCEYMTGALKYWLREAGVDGFRCDVAGMVPTDFWNNARRELDAIKPVFMLAEWEERDLHAEAFDMTYAWTWYDAVHLVTTARTGLFPLYRYYSHQVKGFPPDAYRMTFVSNHDKNSWDGTEFEQFGDGLEAAIVLSMTGEGMPLIYNGQEAGNERRLSFFEKDPIVWREHPLGELYRKLIALRKETRALWNGASGARMIHAPNTAPDSVFSFTRQDAEAKVFVALNFSDQPRTVQFTTALQEGAYVEALTGQPGHFNASTPLTLGPWGYRVYVSKA